MATRLFEQSKELGFKDSAIFSINDYIPKFAELKEGTNLVFVFVAATYTGLPASSANMLSRWISSNEAKSVAKYIKYTVSTTQVKNKETLFYFKPLKVGIWNLI